MNKSNEAAQKGFPERPPKLIKAQDKNTTFPPDLSTIITRSGTKVAYLSIPSGWSEEIKDQVLRRVRNDRSDLRIESFMTAFTLNELLTESPTWIERVQKFITGADALIVATDSTRIVGPGIRFEINVARKSGKRIILFDVTTGSFHKFFGYDLAEGRSIRLRRGLRTKAEKEELARRLKKRLKKREKQQRRLAGKIVEGRDQCQLN